ncbi:MAG: hypothetical protein Q9209_004856 [Squamulea sp. 1 TL-2023]
MTETREHPLSGLWKPTQLQALYYGPASVQNHLLPCPPSSTSKAFIITGSSLPSNTPLIKQVETLLGAKHHAGTFSKIAQHAPVAQLDKAIDAVQKDEAIDTLVSIGGGSLIDSAKAISHYRHERSGKSSTILPSLPSSASPSAPSAPVIQTKREQKSAWYTLSLPHMSSSTMPPSRKRHPNDYGFRQLSGHSIIPWSSYTTPPLQRFRPSSLV